MYMSCNNICHISAKDEGKHCVNIQEVTSLADSYDSPVICADLEVSTLFDGCIDTSKVCFGAKWPIRLALNSGFCSMK